MLLRKLVLIAAFVATRTDVSCLVLRPVSEPLMKAGKSLGLAGEALVSLTEKEPLACYGGALSGCGASLRNAGDCLAQCGATCRNKFGSEIAGDEMRESAVCLEEARAKLRAWVEAESTADNEQHLKVSLEAASAIGKSSEAAEIAGRIIFSQGQKGKASKEEKSKQELVLNLLGLSTNLLACSDVLRAAEVAEGGLPGWGGFCDKVKDAAVDVERAGEVLRDGEKKPSGGSWLKG